MMAVMPALAITEKQFQAELVELLERFGWRTYHTFDSRRSAAGFPDLIAVKGPRLLAIEVKSEAGVVSLDQRAWLTAFAAVPGVIALVIRPAADLSELAAIL
jgi:Holliday junction resolvase